MRGASFAQVLDRIIDPSFDERGRAQAVAPSVTTAPIGGAPFMHRWAYVDLPLGRPVPPRPTRLLNARMRSALDVLRAAGAADLQDDFLAAELKRAFRRLARRAHPDMHPGATDRERRCLMARFREIHEAYQTLASCPS